jgi:predicted O-methyltransferase YrrM
MDLKRIIEQSKASIEKADLEVLLPLVARLKPKTILEIGAWRGYSIEVWYNAFKPSKLITIENESVALDFINERVKNYEFAYMDPSPTLIALDSHSDRALTTVVKELKEDLVDFLFIDGDHSYEGVKKDFHFYSPLVRRGGIIAFHDILCHADGTEEVDIFWKEIKDTHPMQEIKESQNSTGIGVLWNL